MWTNEEIQIVKENHNKKTLMQILSLLNNKTYYCLRSKAQRMGLYRDENLRIPNKNTHNTEFWKEPTLLNSYLAGAIAGDGCLFIDKNKTMNFTYKVAIKDEFMIDLLKKELNFTGPKSYTQNKSPHSDKICKMVYVRMGAFQNNAEYLKQHFNLIPRKTKRLGPTNLQDKNLNLAFLVGCIDSDGSVEYQKKDKDYHLYLGVNSSSKSIVEWVKMLIDSYFPYSTRVAQVRHHIQDNYYRYYIGGVRAAMIFNYLKSLPIPKFPRKWENPLILDYVNRIKKEHPSLFTEYKENSVISPTETLDKSAESAIISTES